MQEYKARCKGIQPNQVGIQQAVPLKEEDDDDEDDE